MTQQEAALFAARLTRIWLPKSIQYKYKPGIYPGFEYWAMLGQNLRLRVDNDDEEINFDLERGPVLLMAKPSLGIIDVSDLYQDQESKLAFQVLQSECLPLFRRNCWLSGCDVEASAHEKAEWMQGCSQEEIEAWNLKV